MPEKQSARGEVVIETKKTFYRIPKRFFIAVCAVGGAVLLALLAFVLYVFWPRQALRIAGAEDAALQSVYYIEWYVEDGAGKIYYDGAELSERPQAAEQVLDLLQGRRCRRSFQGAAKTADMLSLYFGDAGGGSGRSADIYSDGTLCVGGDTYKMYGGDAGLFEKMIELTGIVRRRASPGETVCA